MSIEDSKLAAVLIEMTSRFSKLPPVDSPVRALEMLQRQEQREIGEQFVRMLETNFTRWQRIHSPVHAIWFYRIKKQHSKDAKSVDRSDWVNLKALIIRIRFGYHLNFRCARFLECLIREQLVTERDVWRLLHSPGCSTSKEGLAPAPLPLVAGILGLSFSLLLGLLAVLLLHPLVTLAFGECRSPICQIVGNAVLAFWLLLIGYVIAVGTWGRRDAAKVVSMILALDFSGRRTEMTAVRRPLLVKLLW